MEIKASLDLVLEKVRSGFFRFGVFHFCVVAIAVLLVLSIHDVIYDSTMLHLTRGICWGALAGVFVQLVGEWKGFAVGKWLVTVITVAVGALGCWFWMSIGETSPHYWGWMMLYGGSSFAMVAASMAVLCAYSNEKTLVPRLLLNALGASACAVIFIVSQMICLLAFDKLILPVNQKIYLDVWGFSWIVIFAVGFISFLPGRNQDDEASDRATASLFWLLLPASLLLLGILYIYLARIVISWSMPSGMLNWFGSVALAAYAFFWLSLRGSSRRFFRLFARWGWVLLLPVLAAQVVGIVIRHQAYGLSTLRFAGMITLSFGIVVLILAALDRRPRLLFVYMAVAGLVFTVSPLNIVDLPVLNQEARLRAALERNGFLNKEGLQLKTDVKVSEKDAKIIAGAWKYLVPEGTWVKTVWHRPDFTIGIFKSVKTLPEVGKGDNEYLLSLLGHGNGKKSSGKSNPDYATMEFRVAGDGFMPIAGYSHCLAIAEGLGVQCYRDRGRWTLQYAFPGHKGWVTHDVTKQVERIFKASGCNGLIAKDLKFELTAAEAVWELRPGRALVIGGFRTSGTVGREISNVQLPRCVLVEKREH